MYYSTHYKSPLGELLLISDESNIIGLHFKGQKNCAMPEDVVEKEGIQVLQKGVKWLDDYFAGKRPEISSLPLAPIGGEFRQAVWKILTEIPYGETTTYGQIAKEVAGRLGKARMSAQAVGGAVGHNPICIIIPCHRVVGTDGNLTGFASGLERKIKLLEHEGVNMNRLFVPKKGTAL